MLKLYKSENGDIIIEFKHLQATIKATNKLEKDDICKEVAEFILNSFNIKSDEEKLKTVAFGIKNVYWGEAMSVTVEMEIDY